jgi:hypothetical protein
MWEAGGCLRTFVPWEPPIRVPRTYAGSPTRRKLGIKVPQGREAVLRTEAGSEPQQPILTSPFRQAPIRVMPNETWMMVYENNMLCIIT